MGTAWTPGAAGGLTAVGRGRRRIDVGDVDGQRFAVMAGIGFDAELLHGASAPLKARIGSPAYVLSALRHLRDHPMPVEIRVDDDPPRHRLARAVLVANVGRLEGGVRLVPHADPSDGHLDVVVLAPRNLGQWAALAWAVIRRRDHLPRVELLRGTRVTVITDRDRPREPDGDVISPAPTLTAYVHPGGLWLCVAHPDQHPDLTTGAPPGPG